LARALYGEEKKGEEYESKADCERMEEKIQGVVHKSGNGKAGGTNALKSNKNFLHRQASNE